MPRLLERRCGNTDSVSESKIVICRERCSGALWPGVKGRKSAVEDEGLERKSLTTGAW